jgi:hypothetical protein
MSVSLFFTQAGRMLYFLLRTISFTIQRRQIDVQKGPPGQILNERNAESRASGYAETVILFC